MKKIFLVTIIIVVLVVAVVLLFNTNLFKKDSTKLSIVTTTTMLTDLAKVIGGDKVNVNGLMGYGVDPHLYNASAGDVAKLQNADVVIYNGIHLEGKMSEIFAQLSKKTVLSAENYIHKTLLLNVDGEDNTYDPHIWFDVNIWKVVAIGITNDLCNIDKENLSYYENNLNNYIIELDNLNNYINKRIQEVPKDQRILITAHDAFNYFGNKYNFQVKGLQGISTDSEAGTADISNLANFIYDNKIKAVFVESSVPTRTIESLQAAVKSKGFEVKIGGELYSDSLGDIQSGHETYIKTFKANIDTIINNLK